MGDMVGVHTEAELEALSPQEREQLKREILEQLQNSPEIRARINEEPQLLTRDERICEILRRNLRDRLKK
jgi:hypothetical protein